MALLESLKPKASHDAGVWRLPDGDAYYALALQTETTTTMTPAEVHKMGLDQTRALSARAEVLFKKIGMTQGTVGERYAALYKVPKYIYPNTDAGKAKEIADLNKLVQAMQKRLPAYFATLPKAGLGDPGGFRRPPRPAPRPTTPKAASTGPARHLLAEPARHRRGALLGHADDHVPRGHSRPPSAAFPAAPGRPADAAQGRRLRGLYRRPGRSMPSSWRRRWASTPTTPPASWAMCTTPCCARGGW